MPEADFPKLIPATELNWRGVLKGVAKAADSYQPLFEAFTNSLEAIELRSKSDNRFTPSIIVDLFFNTDLEGDITGLSKLAVSDNGIGFDDENFKRLQVFKDESKGFNNRGSGRLQLLHSFTKVKYESTFRQDGTIGKRSFILSKRDEFLNKNAILQLLSEESCPEDTEIRTKVTMEELRENVDIKFYRYRSIDDIKRTLIDHYIMQFCAYGQKLPSITITFFKGAMLSGEEHITPSDIPSPNIEDQTIKVPICKISNDMKRIEATEERVDIIIKSFKLPSSQIKKNAVKLTCKKELIDSVKVKMDCLPPELEVDSHRFLFLLSSSYFDDNIGDTRDSFEVLNKSEFKKKAKQYGAIAPQIVLDDIEDGVSRKASEMYTEIAQQKEIHEQQLKELKDTYMLSEEALADANINDSVEDILAKAYAYDAKLIAKQDAAYREKKQQLESLDTTSETYQQDLETLVKDMSETIPLQSKESLARYVTRRALVIDLLDKLIHKGTDIQRNTDRSIDEKLIHNLIFSQHSGDSSKSDMWLLNEDYLHYNGFSEHRLCDIAIKGKKLFKEIIDDEEQRYLNSLGEQRLKKRPDILLFPSEHKCVIVELKSLDVNVSDYLGQIQKYATFIRSYTNEEFRIDTFYGYLVGEALEPNDVRATDPDFKYDSKFNFCYRPVKTVACLGDQSGNQDGTIYTEAISFSVLLDRAKKRNESFKAKLFPTIVEQEREETE
jgi:hypothetical protein